MRISTLTPHIITLVVLLFALTVISLAAAAAATTPITVALAASATSTSDISSIVDLSSSTPIVDAAHVPTFIRNYNYLTPSSLASFQSGNNLTQLPARTASYIYIVSDTHLMYSYKITNDSSMNQVIKSNQTITPNVDSICSQAVISPTRRDSTTYPDSLLRMYVVCTPNLIYTINANDTTGEFSINYDTPIHVNFNSSMTSTSFDATTIDDSTTTTTTVVVPILTGQVKIQQQQQQNENGDALSDLLLISGSGALFTIDASTGQHRRPQFGPTSTGLPSSGTLTNISFIVNSDTRRVYCASTTDMTGQFVAFILTMSSEEELTYDEWNVTYSSLLTGPINGTEIKIFETSNSVYYTINSIQSYAKDVSIYRLDKSTLTMQNMTATGVASNYYSFKTLKYFYEPIPFTGIVLMISDAPGTSVWRLDFTQSKVIHLDLTLHNPQLNPDSYVDDYSTTLLDIDRGKLYFVYSYPIAVAELRSMITDSRVVYVWNYLYVQDHSFNATRPYQYTSFGDHIMLSVGAPSTNSIIVYNIKWNHLTPLLNVQVFTSEIAPHCNELPPPSTNISMLPTCYCESLMREKTARNCAYNNNAGGGSNSSNSTCEDVLVLDYNRECHPSTPDKPDPAKWFILLFLIGLAIAVLSGFIGILMCIWSLIKRIDVNRQWCGTPRRMMMIGVDADLLQAPMAQEMSPIPSRGDMGSTTNHHHHPYSQLMPQQEL